MSSPTGVLRGWLSGAQTLAVGLMSEPTLRRTAMSVRGAAGSVVQSGARAWARGFSASKYDPEILCILCWYSCTCGSRNRQCWKAQAEGERSTLDLLPLIRTSPACNSTLAGSTLAQA